MVGEAGQSAGSQQVAGIPRVPVRSRRNDLPAVRGDRSRLQLTLQQGVTWPVTRALWKNRDNLWFASRLLRHGVCDTCTYPHVGLYDPETGRRVACRQRLLRLSRHTMAGLAPADLINLARLEGADRDALVQLGRLTYPYVRERGDRGFRRVRWREAIRMVVDRIGGIPGERMAFLAEPAELTNEAAYAFAKAARAFGSPHVAPCSVDPHVDMLHALDDRLGPIAVRMGPASLRQSQLVLHFGDTPDPTGAVARYLDGASRAGARLVAVRVRQDGQHGLDPGFDDLVFIDPNGHSAFLRGVLKVLIERDAVDHHFGHRFTHGWEPLRDRVLATPWSELEARSGARRADIEWVGELATRARAIATVTRGASGLDARAVTAAADLHLARGAVGQPGAGVLPLPLVSGAGGARRCGLAPDRFPGDRPIDDESGELLRRAWGGLEPARRIGMGAPQVLSEAGSDAIEALYAASADLSAAGELGCLDRIRVRIHQSAVLDPSMLAPAGDLVVLLPARTIFEQPGGGTRTGPGASVVACPDVGPNPHWGEARPQTGIVGTLLGHLRPQLEGRLFGDDARPVRAELTSLVPGWEDLGAVDQGETRVPTAPALGTAGSTGARARFSGPAEWEPLL